MYYHDFLLLLPEQPFFSDDPTTIISSLDTIDPFFLPMSCEDHAWHFLPHLNSCTFFPYLFVSICLHVQKWCYTTFSALKRHACQILGSPQFASYSIFCSACHLLFLLSFLVLATHLFFWQRALLTTCPRLSNIF